MSSTSCKLTWLGLTALVAAGVSLAVVAPGCGGAPSRESARDQATTHTCARYETCMAIGPGKAFPDDQDCALHWQAQWDSEWPAATCEGKIDQAAFTVCLEAIDSASCNLGDLLLTLLKCDAMNVCHASADAGGN
jgi:hypothetical protein